METKVKGLLTLAAIAATLACSSSPDSNRAPLLAEQGKSYKVDQDFVGPRNLADRDRLLNAARYDQQGGLEMVLRGQAAMVSEGETVLVVNHDISMLNGIWLQVRITQGVMKGLVWIPQASLERFNE